MILVPVLFFLTPQVGLANFPTVPDLLYDHSLRDDLEIFPSKPESLPSLMVSGIQDQTKHSTTSATKQSFLSIDLVIFCLGPADWSIFYLIGVLSSEMALSLTVKIHIIGDIFACRGSTQVISNITNENNDNNNIWL